MKIKSREITTVEWYDAETGKVYESEEEAMDEFCKSYDFENITALDRDGCKIDLRNLVDLWYDVPILNYCDVFYLEIKSAKAYDDLMLLLDDDCLKKIMTVNGIGRYYFDGDNDLWRCVEWEEEELKIIKKIFAKN